MRFDSYHPVINLIYFAAAIVCTIWFHHPVFLGISYVCAFVYSVKLNGKRAVIFNLCLIPLIFLYAAWYSYYNHFGVTNLRQNFIGNQITLESVVYGIVRGTTVAAVIMFFSCVFAVVSSDKVVYLFGRISPRLSLFLSILLRCVPRVKRGYWERGTAGKYPGEIFARIKPDLHCDHLDAGGFCGKYGFHEEQGLFAPGKNGFFHLSF